MKYSINQNLIHRTALACHSQINLLMRICPEPRAALLIASKRWSLFITHNSIYNVSQSPPKHSPLTNDNAVLHHVQTGGNKPSEWQRYFCEGVEHELVFTRLLGWALNPSCLFSGVTVVVCMHMYVHSCANSAQCNASVFLLQVPLKKFSSGGNILTRLYSFLKSQNVDLLCYWLWFTFKEAWPPLPWSHAQ